MKRRDFLKTAAASALSVQIVPRHVLGGPGNTPPSEKLNMASVGVQGMGEYDTNSFASGPINMVAICDVNETNLAKGGGTIPLRQTLYRLAQAARPRGQEYRGRKRLHSRPHAHARQHVGHLARQARLLPEAAHSQHLRSAADCRRRPQGKGRHPDGHPDPLQHRVPHGHGVDPGGDNRQGEGGPFMVGSAELAAGWQAPHGLGPRARPTALGPVAGRCPARPFWRELTRPSPGGGFWISAAGHWATWAATSWIRLTQP